MKTVQSHFNYKKYKPFKPVNMDQRQWPDKVLQQAPQWCSVDLRDGNQALVHPLSVEQKMTLFKLLLEVGFKEIEVGFPSASQADYDFVRDLIEGHYIPDDVTIAILTPARETFIERSFQALNGAKQAIVHLYNSTSKIQREQVFNKDKAGITKIAVDAAKVVKKCAESQPETDWCFQYSPESFTATELDYAIEICNVVNDVWQPTAENPVILNLPSTVEMSMPNIYADQIEWFGKHIAYRDAIIISVHTHNDRGCAVAAAEMAVLAGAQRVEGTLLGNGERTGNMDIITMAMNCYSQGIDPQLDLANIQTIAQQVSDLIQIDIHPRHPYIGDLVFTAFSGSHQDAINKCIKNYRPGEPWEVAYLPIDPSDLGRSYKEVIRINSQSGKGGIAYIIEQAMATEIPRWLQIEFSHRVQQETEKTAAEIQPEELVALFNATYVNSEGLFQIENYTAGQNADGKEITEFVISHSGRQLNLQTHGVGILDCFVSALAEHFALAINIIEYNEQTLKPDNAARAIAFVQLDIEGHYCSAVAQHTDIVMASLNAILQAIESYSGFYYNK